MRLFPRWIAVVAMVPVLGGCGGTDDDELVVFAASSLVDAFAELAAAFEDANPGVDVVVTVGPSSRLREQIAEGAPADVVALASVDAMAPLVDAELVSGAPLVFATNSLVLVVPSGNPAGIGGLADLEDADLLVGVCAPGVPCGDLAVEVETDLGLDFAPDTEAPDARALLALVADGELDAGLVYATDARAADVDVVATPDTASVTTRYQIAPVRDSSDRDLAAAFVALVVGDGASVLSAHGFGAP